MNKSLVFIITVLVSVVGFAQKINHPALVFTPNRIQEAKVRLKTDSVLVSGWNDIKKIADESMTKTDLLKCDYISLAYLMTGEKKYAEKVRDILLSNVRQSVWYNNAEMLARRPAWNSDLQLAHKCNVSAISYDAIYNFLSANERKEIAEGLYRLGVAPSLGDWFLEPTRIHSLNSMGHNWWTSCVCNGGLLALSIQNEVKDAQDAANQLYRQLPEWFSFAGDEYQNKAKNCDVNGGMYESVNYANFGISEALLFLLSYQNSHPQISPSIIPEIANADEFFEYMCYPKTDILNSVNFGDSHLNITGENTLLMLYALGNKNENILWYLNQIKQGQNRDGYFQNKPIGFLYWPSLKSAPLVPKLNLSQIFPDFGWASMRQSWAKNSTMLAIKSGHTWNHSHADANSFIIFQRGENILKEAGHCWYPNPEYSDYFFQSRAHNVVLFNGEGQPTQQQYEGSMLDGKLTNLLDAGNIRYILANGTGPMSNNLTRNFRHFLWIDDVLYIIDDLKSYKAGQFEWLWHPEGEVTKKGYDLNITKGAAAIVIRPLYPEQLAPSNFTHDYPNSMLLTELQGPTEFDLKKTETYYSVKYRTETNKVKGMTAIILKDSVNDVDLPKTELIDGKNWIGVRVTNKGKTTDIIINQLSDGTLMHSNSWINAEGWETDAAIMAVSYPENKQPDIYSEVVLVYGSALRREGVSYVSSLSKVYAIIKKVQKEVSVVFNGQTKLVLNVYSKDKPQNLLVNRKKTEIHYVNDQLVIGQ